MIRNLIAWAVTRRGHYLWRRKMVDSRGETSAVRHEFLWCDEWISGKEVFHRPPWWRPFNAFLHWWDPRHEGEIFHDHPRWSVTVCLQGRLLERTPWGERLLSPGSVVFRTRKAIHAFYIPKEWRGKTWTLFIVGRRNHKQNYYHIIPMGQDTAFRKEKP